MFALRKAALAIALATIGAPGVALAVDVGFEAVPTSWMIQNYLIGTPQGINIWRTNAPAPCGGQGGNDSRPFALQAQATEHEANRFWSMLLTAQATNTVIGIWYDNQTCLISSFYTVPR